MSVSRPDPIVALKKRLHEGALHHGILLLGKSVPSAENAALLLAQELLSLDQETGIHPDLFHLRPTGKARIITVEKTRELISIINRTSNQGGCKVAIIHEADRMRKEAANAFLKTLEEPPPDTFILLTTSRPYSLLATIRSRCLLVRLPKEKNLETDQDWETWKNDYQEWILCLLDRENLKKDRVSPLFQAYGLAASLLALISQKSDTLAKEARQQSIHMEEKERDAQEAGLRRGIRSHILAKLADATRSVVVDQANLAQFGIKLSRVLRCLEKNTGLMEVNLKDDAAMEDFYLSSLRIWTAK
ncbi:MAG: DNA polymerase III subunit gamma/tau [Opitutae bacterium]|nr:DNA polymerase III subunit gamma/tau [Opitutae bacterium]